VCPAKGTQEFLLVRRILVRTGHITTGEHLTTRALGQFYNTFIKIGLVFEPTKDNILQYCKLLKEFERISSTINYYQESLIIVTYFFLIYKIYLQITSFKYQTLTEAKKIVYNRS
jgi:hypothetical protein